MITAEYLAPVLPTLLPFVAAGAAPGSLIVRPDGERLHLRQTAHEPSTFWPACGQRSAGAWALSAPASDHRTLCRRCLPAGRAMRWACQVLEEQPRAVAQLLADAVWASLEDRVAELKSVAVHAQLAMQRVRGPGGHEVFLHQLIGDRRRHFQFGTSIYSRTIRDVHLPEPEAI